MVTLETIKNKPKKINVQTKNGKNSNYSKHTEFNKKDGIKYCEKCGKECIEAALSCEVCNNENFLSTGISETIGGFIELSKNGNLRKYYQRTMNINSSIKMNNKRLIHQLIAHKNSNLKFNKELIDKIYNSNVTFEKRNLHEKNKNII